jgi:hypothetical protein
MSMHHVGIVGMQKHDVSSAVEKFIFDAHFRKKNPIISFYVSLDHFIQIKRWPPIKNWTTTLLTHFLRRPID